MANEIQTSKLFSVNFRDILKGALVATLTPVIVLIQQSLEAGTLVFNWNALAMAAIGGFLAYLIKNFFTPTQVVVKKVNDDPAPEPAPTPSDRPPGDPIKP